MSNAADEKGGPEEPEARDEDVSKIVVRPLDDGHRCHTEVGEPEAEEKKRNADQPSENSNDEANLAYPNNKLQS
jgi:hypothetical protein